MSDFFRQPWTYGLERVLPQTPTATSYDKNEVFFQVQADWGPGMLVLSSPNAFVEWEVSTSVKFASGTSTSSSSRLANAANEDRNLYQTGAAYHAYVPCYGQGAQVKFLHAYSIAAGVSVNNYGLEYAADDPRLVRAIFYPGQLDQPRSVLGIGCDDLGFPAQAPSLSNTVTRFYPPGNRGLVNVSINDQGSNLNYMIRTPPSVSVATGVRLPCFTLRVPPWGLLELSTNSGGSIEPAVLTWQTLGAGALWNTS